MVYSISHRINLFLPKARDGAQQWGTFQGTSEVPGLKDRVGEQLGDSEESGPLRNKQAMRRGAGSLAEKKGVWHGLLLRPIAQAGEDSQAPWRNWSVQEEIEELPLHILEYSGGSEGAGGNECERIRITEPNKVQRSMGSCI